MTTGLSVSKTMASDKSLSPLDNKSSGASDYNLIMLDPSLKVKPFQFICASEKSLRYFLYQLLWAGVCVGTSDHSPVIERSGMREF